ncbi:MAG: MerR family DNA-binding transcriptional regulator [Anaerolineales bacterium]|nr:MerR family DNA-binding transcriptional regulator [Anaerolineales bacterium]
MIRIGDFSKLSRVPVKTLRYYDEMGLLEPV